MKILQPHKPGCQAEQSKLCKAMDKKEALTRLRPTWQGTNAVDQVLALVREREEEVGRWEVKIQQREREREKGALKHRRRERAEPLGETLRQRGSQNKGRYRRQRERRHRRREGHLAHECRSSIVGRLARDREEEEESWED
ncbi:hypothetical protein B296_00010471 [Ensete ventricosum]|uniref:Uncharacterized protein n=1 Tax=Ensete ventricosum TaxID=4639 RepID=A0A426ZX27_ENSVE|nr:hypothetical protein B296_00010471 [Ensete ventricosum]